MKRLDRTHRPLAAFLALALVLLPGCQTTVKEHKTHGQPGSVVVKPYWKDSHGNKLMVGGLQCWLARKGEGPSTLVAQQTTEAGKPLVFSDLTPGRYRLSVLGGSLGKKSVEFEIRKRRRVTVRIDVSANAGKTFKEGAKAVGEGALFVLTAIGAVALIVLIVALEVSAEDDDDDDC